MGSSDGLTFSDADIDAIADKIDAKIDGVLNKGDATDPLGSFTDGVNQQPQKHHQGDQGHFNPSFGIIRGCTELCRVTQTKVGGYGG